MIWLLKDKSESNVTPRLRADEEQETVAPEKVKNVSVNLDRCFGEPMRKIQFL